MKVYIDNLTIPDTCFDCPFNYDYLYCLITEEKSYGLGKRKDCPLKEIKISKWIEEFQGDGWNDWISLTCPVCGKVHNRVPYIYNYCPDCGTYMKGEEDE